MRLYTSLKLMNILSLHTAEFLHFFYATSVKIFMFQQCRKFVMTAEYVNRENARILKKISTQVPQFKTLLEYFNNLHKSLFFWYRMLQLVEALPYKPERSKFIPEGVNGKFHRFNPHGRTTALGSTQPLKEMGTRGIFWVVKAAGAYG
jgi:hypothetical protein